MPSSQPDDGITGFQTPSSGASQFNAISFLFWSLLARVRTCTLVKVVAVTNSGQDIPAGFVDVQPLVQQWDGKSVVVRHGVVYHLPYFRLQGGANAVIIDPQKDDIGLAAFCDRDISSVVATQAEAPPGSHRVFDMADGLYIGGFLGQTPTQFVRFSDAGIDVESPVGINLAAPNISLAASDTLTLNGDKVVQHGLTSLHVDADGNGFVWTADHREDYVIGSTAHSSPLNPPEVP